jgi:3-oxoacyl-[acyl-carrier protein] reductase
MSSKPKTALISGASHGIGEAIAVALGKKGYRIVFFGKTASRVAATQNLLNNLSIENEGAALDVLSPSFFSKIQELIENGFGGVDILINNVGGGGRWGHQDILQTNEEVWQEVFDKNFTVARKLTQICLPYMLSESWGRVVSITSLYGKQIGGRPWFNVAKVAQATLMKNLSLRREYSSNGITFNNVAPGPILIPNTGWDKLRAQHPQRYQETIDSLPLGRLGTPPEVAAVVAFLCSDEASLVNGASIAVDGGESVCP